MLTILADLARIVGYNQRTLSKWIRLGRLQACRWGVARRNNGWFTTLLLLDVAQLNNWTNKQREANKVANELIREFDLERVL